MSTRTTILALALAAGTALVATAPAASAAVVLSRLVTLHGSATGALRWQPTNPDVGRRASLYAQGTVTPLGTGAVFSGSEHFPGFVATGYVLGRGKLSSPKGTITLTFKFGPYKGVSSKITTPGTYQIVGGTGQFVGATGQGAIRETIGALIGTGPSPRPQRLKLAFNPPPVVVRGLASR